MSFGSVGVVGAGLIGGSVALRLRDLGVRVVVHDPDRATLAAARAAGLETGDPADVGGCDLVVLAVPLDVLGSAMVGLDAAVVIDVGSVKAPAAAAAAAAGIADRYVGCHPMSGTEESGFAHASADLLVGVTWAVTWGEPDTPVAPVVAWLLDVFAATVVVLPAAAHDRAVALVSQAPHVLANALLAVVEGADAPVARHLAAGSFRDGTRVAGRNAVRTHNMLAENAEQVAGVLDDLITELTAYRAELTAPALLDRLDDVARGADAVRAPRVAAQPYADLPTLLADHRGEALQLRAGTWARLG